MRFRWRLDQAVLERVKKEEVLFHEGPQSTVIFMHTGLWKVTGDLSDFALDILAIEPLFTSHRLGRAEPRTVGFQLVNCC